MPLAPTDAWLAEVKSRVVELPLARKQRFMREYQLPAPDAESFVNDVPLGIILRPSRNNRRTQSRRQLGDQQSAGEIDGG